MELLGTNNIATDYIGSIYPRYTIYYRITISCLSGVTAYIAANQGISI